MVQGYAVVCRVKGVRCRVEVVGLRGVKRAVFHEITKEAIKRAYTLNPHPTP